MADKAARAKLNPERLQMAEARVMTLVELLAEIGGGQNPAANQEARNFHEADKIAAASLATMTGQTRDRIEQLIVAAAITNIVSMLPNRSFERAMEIFDRVVLTARVTFINGLNTILQEPEQTLADGTKISGLGVLRTGRVHAAQGLRRDTGGRQGRPHQHHQLDGGSTVKYCITQRCYCWWPAVKRPGQWFWRSINEDGGEMPLGHFWGASFDRATKALSQHRIAEQIG